MTYMLYQHKFFYMQLQRVIHGKNDFDEGFKILLDINQKIILLELRYN